MPPTSTTNPYLSGSTGTIPSEYLAMLPPWVQALLRGQTGTTGTSSYGMTPPPTMTAPPPPMGTPPPASPYGTDPYAAPELSRHDARVQRRDAHQAQRDAALASRVPPAAPPSYGSGMQTPGAFPWSPFGRRR